LATALAVAAAIAAASDEVYTPERGFRLFGHTWGERIDFTHTYPTMSKWGVHYLGVLDALTQAQVVQPTPVRSKAFESLFNQWYEQIDDVKPEKVIHVTVSYDFIWYELGLSNRTERLINAQRVFGPDLSPETTKRFLKNLLGSARWMDQCLMRTPFHPYNWQTHTAHTLSYVALAYPEFAESGTWLEHGRGRMVEHIRKDILDDGGYVERTTSYAAYMFGVFHRYMVMFEHFRGDRSLLESQRDELEDSSDGDGDDNVSSDGAQGARTLEDIVRLTDVNSSAALASCVAVVFTWASTWAIRSALSRCARSRCTCSVASTQFVW
jgi:hypothetical protein